MKRISSKQAKAHAISQDTKRIVFHRDGGLCIYCGAVGLPEAHYIPRSKGGLGIPENIVTLCRPCHDMFDHGKREDREKIRKKLREHLMNHYPEWDETELIYRRLNNE